MAETTTSTHATYRSVQKNPIDRNRRATEYPFIIFLGLIFLVWIGISLYVIIAKPSASSNSDDKSVQNMTSSIDQGFNSLSYITQSYSISGIGATIWCLFFVTFFMCIVLLSLRWLPKVCSVIGIICIIVSMIYSIFQLFDKTVYSSSHLMKGYSILTSLIQPIFLAVVLFSAYRVGLKDVADVIRKSFRALFEFGSLILFGLFIFIIYIVLTVVTVIAVLQTNVEYPNIIFGVVISITYLYLLNCVYFFTKMVISEAIASWHWSESKDGFSRDSVLNCVYIISRFHLGTVALAATYIVPLVEAIIVVCKFKYVDSPKSSVRRNVIIEVVCKIYLVFSITEFAVIQTAVHGIAFFESVKKTFYLMVKNSSLSLATVNIFSSFLTGASVIVSILSFFSAMLFSIAQHSNKNEVNQLVLQLTVYVSLSILFALPVITVAKSTVHATLLTTMEKEDNNEESGDGQIYSPHDQMI